MGINHKFGNTKAESVFGLLHSDLRFIVPRFQRNYSWKTDKAEQLWLDLFESYQTLLSEAKEEEYQYLLGPIVLVTNPNEYKSFHVIDGQQRLATLTILFCVARDIILEDLNGESKPENFHIIRELIENTKMNKHISWKLVLNHTDKAFFREIQEFESGVGKQIDRIKNKKPKAPSLKLLRDNYMLLHEKITNALYTDFEPNRQPEIQGKDESTLRKTRIANHAKLLNFLYHVRDNNYLIQIIVSDDSSAFQIFETLNERGQTLSKSNLIKNHILKEIDEDEQDELSDKWDKIFDEIVGTKQADDDFILESYHSRFADENSLRSTNKNDSITKKNMYPKIKEMVKDQKSCKKFIGELETDAEFLSQLNDPDNYQDVTTKEEIYVIKALKAKAIRIPLLAAHRRWYDRKSDDYTKLMQHLVKFFFKIRTVREEHPSDIEQMMREITKLINQDKSLNDVLEKINGYDDHDAFKIDFRKRFIPKPQKDAAKYVLQQITIDMGTEYQDVKPIRDLTLEHVLPKNHDKYWKKEDFFDNDGNDKLDDYVHRLGNMTLLKKVINTKIQNSTFAHKKDSIDNKGNHDGYRSSSLEINKRTIVNHEHWTANVVKKREEEFAERADKIWN